MGMGIYGVFGSVGGTLLMLAFLRDIRLEARCGALKCMVFTCRSSPRDYMTSSNQFVVAYQQFVHRDSIPVSYLRSRSLSPMGLHERSVV